MVARLRSDIWVAAYIRRVGTEGSFAALRRRGAPEAGSIYIVLDRLDGHAALFVPAPGEDSERRWTRAHSDEWLPSGEIEAHLTREIRNDPDLWCVEVESRDGRHWLDLARR